MSGENDEQQIGFATEMVSLDDLKPHPRNYQSHPDDEIEHLMQSIREHGLYRNIVVARDDTILAGHGVVLALRGLGWTEVPVKRLSIDPSSPQALKILVADNEIAHLSEKDDRALSELLRQIKDDDVSGLLGTGYDDKMLASLVFVTRSQSEIKDFDAAAEWAGLPEYDEGEKTVQLVVSFRSREDRARFMKEIRVEDPFRRVGTLWTIWWPPKEKDDLLSVKFKG